MKAFAGVLQTVMSCSSCLRSDGCKAANVRSHIRNPGASQVLRELRAETARAMPTGARMQVSPEQGQLMALLVEAIGARRAIEVGTFTGYSSITIARVRLTRCALPSQPHSASTQRYNVRADHTRSLLPHRTHPDAISLVSEHIHHSFIIHHSSFIIHYSSFIIQYWFPDRSAR